MAHGLLRIDRGIGRRLRRAMIVALLVAFGPLGARMAAADPPHYGNALDWVPANASFFSSSLRNKEQWDILVKSKAWAKLNSLPFVQMISQQVQMFYAMGYGPFGPLHAALQIPENQQLAAMVGDLVSNEMAAYGDQRAADITGLVLDVVRKMSNGAATADETESGNEAAGRDPTMNMAHNIFSELNRNIDKLQTPTLVMALKHTDAARVQAQLARLEKLATDWTASQPQFKGRFERAKVGNYEFLTFKLDGGMIPWDQVPLAKIEDKPHEFDQLVDHIKHLQCVLSIGLHDDYLFISIGPSTDHLAAIGTGPRLVERDEFKLIAPLADKRLVKVEYISKEANAVLGGHSDLENVPNTIATLLPAKMPAELKHRIHADLEAMVKDFAGLVPTPGVTLGATTLTERGYDCLTYDWGENKLLDGSKPLDVLDHLGGTPLAAVVARHKPSTEAYQKLVKWMLVGHKYFEELQLPQMSPDQQKQYREFMEFAKPLFARLDKATAEMLIPALADGQGAFVLDAKITSRRWFQGMPSSDSTLPMLEPAFVLGVSDADLLKRAMAEYRSVADAFVDKIREKDPDSLPPDFKIPDPQVRQTAVGEVYSYPFPRDWAVDGQLAPGCGLSQHLAALTIAPKQSAELLESVPLEIEGPAGETKRPLASAAYLDWAGVIEAITPWIDYSANVAYNRYRAIGNGQPNDQGAEEFKQTLAQVHGVLDVLKAFRTVSSASYFENGVLVRHTEIHFRDLE